jgi:hypothetical protein
VLSPVSSLTEFELEDRVTAKQSTYPTPTSVPPGQEAQPVAARIDPPFATYAPGQYGARPTLR